MTKNDCKCIPKVQKKARTPELITSAAMSSVDISALRDCSQLDFYTPAHAYNQAQELCKEMSNHFDNSVERNNKGAEKTVTWLRDYRLCKSRTQPLSERIQTRSLCEH